MLVGPDHAGNHFEIGVVISDDGPVIVRATVRQAFQARADAERQLADAVSVARAEGQSWAAIGAMVGTSGEAARQRYGRPVKR